MNEKTSMQLHARAARHHRAAARNISRAGDPQRREQYLRQIAKDMGISEQHLRLAEYIDSLEERIEALERKLQGQ